MMIFSTTGSVYSPAMVERLAEIDEVIALKDEYGDLRLFIETRERLGDRLAWINGMAETLAAPYFAAGAGRLHLRDHQLRAAIQPRRLRGRYQRPLGRTARLVATKIRPLRQTPGAQARLYDRRASRKR